MKAMVLKETGPEEGGLLELADMDTPTPGPGELLLRVRTCGVCHTDLHTVEGELELPRLPLIPGHQIVATVEALGDGAEGFAEGDRVGVTWLNSSCGSCGYCCKGLENLCDSARFTGLHVDGGFAEHAVVPASYAHSIPDGFDDAQAAPLLCAGVIGYRSLLLSGIQPGERLGLYGFGASAHVCIQIAKHQGCEVYVFTRSEEHREHALELGAVWAGDAKATPPEKMDASVTFAPAGWLIPEALRVLRKGGTLAINAIHMSPIPEFSYDLLWGERIVRSVANVTRQDAREFLALAAEIPVRTDVEEVPLEEANLALQRLKAGDVRGAVVLRMAD